MPQRETWAEKWLLVGTSTLAFGKMTFAPGQAWGYAQMLEDLLCLSPCFNPVVKKEKKQQSLCEWREIMGEKTSRKNEKADCYGEKSFVLLKTIVSQNWQDRRVRAG